MRERLDDVLFDGAHGNAERLGNVRLLQALQAVEDKDLARGFLELHQRRDHAAQVFARRDDALGGDFTVQRELGLVVPAERSTTYLLPAIAVSPAIGGDREDERLRLLG